MATSLIRRMPGTIETSSRIRAWWLNTFQGYRVTQEKLLPRKGSFGRVTYHHVWVLSNEPGEA